MIARVVTYAYVRRVRSTTTKVIVCISMMRRLYYIFGRQQKYSRRLKSTNCLSQKALRRISYYLSESWNLLQNYKGERISLARQRLPHLHSAQLFDNYKSKLPSGP